MTESLVRIPQDRVGVLIGQEGETKREIEERSGVVLQVDGSSGEVVLVEDSAFEPVLTLKVREVVRAIGRGFSPERAFRLFQDDVYLEVVDMTDFVGHDGKRLHTVRGRLIGSRGKTREAIETFTGVQLSIRGRTVAIMGEAAEMTAARDAVEMLLNGAPHPSVYKFLERKRRELRLEELGLG